MEYVLNHRPRAYQFTGYGEYFADLRPPERFGRSLVEAMRKQHDELLAKISETEVEKWIQLVDGQRKRVLLSVASGLTYPATVHRKMGEDTTGYYQNLKDTLLELNKPIVQMGDQISIIQDKFKSKFTSITYLTR